MDEFLLLVSYISNRKECSPNELANFMHITTKTLFKKIDGANETLKKNNAGIIVLENGNYHFNIQNEANYNELLHSYVENSYHAVPNSDSGRITFILNKLLKSHDYIKRSTLAELMYVSEKTVSNCLSSIEMILKNYDLAIDRKPNYGIHILGSEFSKRQCIINHLITPYDKFINHQLEEDIAPLILDIAKKHNLEFSEISLQNLFHYVGVSTYRIKENFVMEDMKDKNLVIGEARDVSQEILDSLKKEGFIQNYPANEIDYLAIFVKADRIIFGSVLPNTVISPYLESITNELFGFIEKQFGICLGSSLQLYLLLLRHLSSLDVRLRYDISVDCQIPEDYKEKYSYAYMIAEHSSFIFESYYQKPMNENEIYLFALFIEMAFEYQNRDESKLNILLVCPTGKISSMLLKMNLEEEFSKEINSIDMKNIFELDQLDYSKYDVVFSTTPIDVPISVPVMMIYDINGQLNFKQIKKDLHKVNLLSPIQSFYRKEMFIEKMKANNKENVINNIVTHISKYYEIDKDSKQLIMNREALGTTDFVDDVAMIHPLRPICKENVVLVAVLDKPVFWGRTDVSLIIFASIIDSKNDLSKKFYEATANFVFNKQSVNKLIKNPSYSMLVNELLSLSKG